MNLLAKHFFDYQSFVNLPHKAVQLHKTPPSQAGVDPSAAWAPKSMHISGKNQPAPAARANRSHVKPRAGGNRHGRAAKMEFRHWGERHGELHAEKIVPHKDAWMAKLQGEFKHFYEYDDTFDSNGVDSAIQHFPMFSQHCVEVDDVEVLAILTLTSQKDFLTVTVKGIRNFIHVNSKPFLRVQLFEGGYLIDERYGSRNENFGYSYCKEKSPNISCQDTIPAPISSQIPDCSLAQKTTKSRRISRGYGKILEAKMHPLIQLFRQPTVLNISQKNVLNLHDNDKQSLFNHFRRRSLRQVYNCLFKHRNVIAGKNTNLALWSTFNSYGVAETDNQKNRKQIISLTDDHQKRNKKNLTNNCKEHKRKSVSPSFSNLHSTTRTTSSTTFLSECFSLDAACAKKSADSITNLGESFMFRTSPSRIHSCHILVQVYICSCTNTLSSPSCLNKKKHEEQPDGNNELRTTKTSDETIKSCLNDTKQSKINNIQNSNLSSHKKTKNINQQEIISNVNNLKLNFNSAFNGSIGNELNLDIQSIDCCDHSSKSSCCGTFNLSNLNSKKNGSKIAVDKDYSTIQTNSQKADEKEIEKTNDVSSNNIQNNCKSLDLHIPDECSNQFPRFCCSKNNPLSNNSPMSESNSSSLDYSQELEKLSQQLNRLYSNDSSDFINGSALSELNAISGGRQSRSSENIQSEITSNSCIEHILHIKNTRNNSGSSNSIVCRNKEYGKNVLVGGFVIGPLGSSRGRWHWRQMVQRHGYPVCMWHRLIVPALPLNKKSINSHNTSAALPLVLDNHCPIV